MIKWMNPVSYEWSSIHGKVALMSKLWISDEILTSLYPTPTPFPPFYLTHFSPYLLRPPHPPFQLSSLFTHSLPSHPHQPPNHFLLLNLPTSSSFWSITLIPPCLLSTCKHVLKGSQNPTDRTEHRSIYFWWNTSALFMCSFFNKYVKIDWILLESYSFFSRSRLIYNNIFFCTLLADFVFTGLLFFCVLICYYLPRWLGEYLTK